MAKRKVEASGSNITHVATVESGFVKLLIWIERDEWEYHFTVDALHPDLEQLRDEIDNALSAAHEDFSKVTITKARTGPYVYFEVQDSRAQHYFGKHIR
jgi:predicted LPLAT superfamily acyltransferase